MTRFARYSTKGIRKPPCEATPWSELAPPAAAQHAAASVPAPETTPNGNTKKQKAKLTASTGKKNKKKSVQRLSVPEVSAADFDESEAKPDKPNVDSSAGLNDVKLNGDNIQVEGSYLAEGHSAKKRKRLVKNPGTPDVPDVVRHQEGGGCAVDVQKQSDEAALAVKGVKRECKDVGLPKHKKKKQSGSDGEKAGVPDVPETQQTDDALKQLDSDVTKSALKNVNGRERPLKKKKQKQQKSKQKLKPGAAATGPAVLAEGPLMTQFEGYWVRRRAVPRLERVKAELAATISDPQTLKREMKKRKRAEHRLLLSQLAARGGRQPTSAAARLQTSPAAHSGEEDNTAGDKELEAEDGGSAAEDGEGAEDSDGGQQEELPPRRKTVADDRNPTAGGGAPKEERMVKFDGVWMTADAVGRLKELRRQLKLQRVSDVVLRQTMKTARRREEMKRKRDAKRVCLGCRQPGHFVSDCPHRAAGVKAPVTGLCFRCGSTEHRLSECRRTADGGKLPYAVCFVCGQTGHLSRDCVLNPNGVYPKGGACKVCHRRDHLADNCPEQKEEAAAASAPRLATLADGGALEDDYQHDFRAATESAATTATPTVRKPRLVRF